MDDINITGDDTMVEEPSSSTPRVSKRKTPRSGLIAYNSPVILSYALISAILLLVDSVLWQNFIQSFFTVPGRGSITFSREFYKIISYALGHANWAHYLGNFTLMLLVGPVLEEKYGSGLLLIMITLTAMITGVLNVLFFSTGLLGASGIVFMMILLVSFTNVKKGQIPLTFILVVIVYVGQEIVNSFNTEDQVSQFAHIIGGAIGGVFGFFFAGKNLKEIKGD